MKQKLYGPLYDKNKFALTQWVDTGPRFSPFNRDSQNDTTN